MSTARIGAAALAASVLLVGCGSNNPSAVATSPSPTPASSPSATPTQSQSTRTLTFKLVACTGPSVCGNANPLNEGKFGQGTVRVDINADTYSITVIAKGFTPKSKHLINVHPGSCATPNLDQFDQLAVATADTRGSLTSVTTLSGNYFVPGPGKILTIHGDDVIRRQTHIACVNLTN